MAQTARSCVVPVMFALSLAVFAAPAVSAVEVTKYQAMPKWKYAVAGNVRSSPVVYEGKVYVGSSDGFVYAVHQEVSE